MSHAGISISGGGGAYGRQQSSQQQYTDDDDGGMQPNVSSPFYRCMYDIERIERAHQLPDIGQRTGRKRQEDAAARRNQKGFLALACR
jgi:hypothetical protein